MRILFLTASDPTGDASMIGRALRSMGHDADIWFHASDAAASGLDRVLDRDLSPARAVEQFLETIDRFDVFHFHGVTTLLGPAAHVPAMWDLPVLRALGKTVVFTYEGDPSALTVVRTYANRIIVGRLRYLRSVPDAVYVPEAIALPEAAAPRDRASGPTVVLVASSSHRGSETRTGIEDIERRFPDAEIRVVAAADMAELLPHIATADVVVAELDADDIGRVSLEAMAYARPVVTRFGLELRAVAGDPPVVDADLSRLARALRPLLADADLRRRIGDEGRSYVESNHSPEAVATTLVEIYSMPTGPVSRIFPGWVGVATPENRSNAEQRARRLQARADELARRLSERDRPMSDLGRLYPDSRALGAVRRLRRIAGGKRR